MKKLYSSVFGGDEGGCFVFVSDTPADNFESYEIVPSDFHNELESFSGVIKSAQIRDFLASDTYSVEAFNDVKKTTKWSLGWNDALAQSFGKEKISQAVVEKIQKALGTVPDGKFGPHSFARLLKIRGVLKEQQQELSTEYINKWDEKSKDTLPLFDAGKDFEGREFLQVFLQNEAKYYGAQIIKPEEIQILDQQYRALAQKGSKTYRLSVDVRKTPYTVTWEEVLPDSYYDKTFGESISLSAQTVEQSEKPKMHTIKRGESVSKILKNEYGVTYREAMNWPVDYRDKTVKKKQDVVKNTNLILPGQLFWIEEKDGARTVIIDTIDSRPSLSKPAKTDAVPVTLPEYLQPSKPDGEIVTEGEPPTKKRDYETPVDMPTDAYTDIPSSFPASVNTDSQEKFSEAPPHSVDYTFDLPEENEGPELSLEKYTWRNYSSHISDYYVENFLSLEAQEDYAEMKNYTAKKDHWWRPDSWEKPFSFEYKKQEIQRHIYIFESIFQQAFKLFDVVPPKTMQEFQDIMDAVWERVKSDPQVYKDGKLLFDPRFADEDSYENYKIKLEAHNRKNLESNIQAQLKGAFKKFERTQKIITILENSIRNKVWERSPKKNSINDE